MPVVTHELKALRWLPCRCLATYSKLASWRKMYLSLFPPRTSRTACSMRRKRSPPEGGSPPPLGGGFLRQVFRDNLAVRASDIANGTLDSGGEGEGEVSPIRRRQGRMNYK